MTMSTRPPISPARSFTERELVRSSGTSETCGIADSRSKPGGFFHGSASPAQTRSAPAATTASTIAWPSAVLASVIEDLAEFRIAGHFAQLAIVGHVRTILLRKRDQCRLSGAVEVKR